MIKEIGVNVHINVRRRFFLEKPEQHSAKSKHGQGSQDRQSYSFRCVGRRRWWRIINGRRAWPNLLLRRGCCRYHDPLRQIRFAEFTTRTYGFTPNDSLFAKIVLRCLEILARKRSEIRLIVLHERRAVHRAIFDDFFVVTLFADRAIFHDRIN